MLGGAMAVIEKLKGRKITKVNYDTTQKNYKLSIGADVIECSKAQKRLVTNPVFRKHIDQVFSEPMRSSYADSVKLHLQNEDVDHSSSIALSKETAEKFATNDELYQTVIEESDSVTVVKFKSAFAYKSGGWNVDLHGKNIRVDILDQVFLSKLNTDDAEFSFGRRFKVTLRESIAKKGGSKRESKSYAILTVHKEV